MLGFWAMIEFLIFNLKNMKLWKASGDQGLARLGIPGTIGDLEDHMQEAELPQCTTPGAPFVLFPLRKVFP